MLLTNIYFWIIDSAGFLYGVDMGKMCSLLVLCKILKKRKEGGAEGKSEIHERFKEIIDI